MVLAAALAAGVGGGSGTAAAAPDPAVVRWSPTLSTGDPVGIELTPDGARLAADHRVPDALLPADGLTNTRSLGLLTLPARPMPVPVDRVDAAVDLTAGTAAAVAVDVRGLRTGGGWTEWLPGEPAVPKATPGTAPTLQVVLPAPVTRVQARLVLTPVASGPVTQVRALHLAAYAAAPSMGAQARTPPLRYRVFATREGLVGGTTANGHVITARDLFVALPSRRALAPRNTGDYTVEVCAPTGRCAFAPVWDVGPWNTRDDYWNPPNRRENWADLPQGMPEAQAARTQGYHGGKDQFGRTVRNPAAIDLADGLFRDALGLTDNAWVTVDYLWTGSGPLATLPVGGRTDLRGAPDSAADVVGVVAGGAAVPVQCRTGRWLRIGTAQFLPAAAVPRAQWPPHLPRCGR